MTVKQVCIEAFDPLLFRDARPFSNELGALTARSLPVPMPGTIAGFIRTFIGNQLGWNWERDFQRALTIKVHAPLLCRQRGFTDEGEFILPAPADALIYRESDTHKVAVLRPFKPPSNAGCNLPHPNLQPLRVEVEAKPESGYSFWEWSDLQSWLLDEPKVPSEPIEGLMRETRVHVAIDDTKGISKESHLYTVEYRAFEQLQGGAYYRWSLLARVYMPDEATIPLSGVGLLGGEKRIVYLHETNQWLGCPESLQKALSTACYVRMMLATPAIFEDGWKPGWLNDDLVGSPPDAANVQLRLVAAAIKRHEAVSGWDYAKQRPKPVRWLVPAGSVYFFELLDGSAEVLASNAWLQPVSDDEANRNAGYGLALWGIWDKSQTIGGNNP